MTYGNTSWNEFSQTLVENSKMVGEFQEQARQQRTLDQNHDLKEKVKNAEDINNILRLRAEKAEAAAKAAQQEVQAFKQLLARPLQEIAEANGDFKKTYELQQELLAEWILAQRAYKETATALGMQVGKTAEEVQQMASQNANAVLENRTEHGNDSTTNPLLAAHATTILAMRKKQGKA
ncbi:hypothetical protein [Ralstonia pseudosolanacearum]